jgi:hypothetical protein
MNNNRFFLWCGTVITLSGLVSCTCVHNDARPTYVTATPEASPLFAKPQIQQQCILVSEDPGVPANTFSLAITRAANSCISSVAAYHNTDCSGGSPDKPEIITRPKSEYFLGTINGNQECEEALRVEKASPCKLYEIYSGGVSYQFCYNYGATPAQLVPVSCCIRHAPPCRL